MTIYTPIRSIKASNDSELHDLLDLGLQIRSAPPDVLSDLFDSLHGAVSKLSEEQKQTLLPGLPNDFVWGHYFIQGLIRYCHICNAGDLFNQAELIAWYSSDVNTPLEAKGVLYRKLEDVNSC